MMELTREQIEAFVLGTETSPEVVAQIEQDLDDPNSLVSQYCRESARMTRMMFDPNGPIMGPLPHELDEMRRQEEIDE